MDASEILALEQQIRRKYMEEARKELERRLQEAANAVPVADKFGAKLTHRERTKMQVRSCFGKLELDVVGGYSALEKRSLTPAREALFGGVRGAMTPLLVRNVAHAGLQAGSFEKGVQLCADWGVTISDDKLMDTIRRVGASCRRERLPALCDEAAGPGDDLVLMGDGWNARHRGPRWGNKKAPKEERIEWKDIKCGLVFKMAHVVPAGTKRKALLHKQVVAVAADAGPEVFGAELEAEAVRMGLYKAGKVYFVSDGGVYLWNIYEERFTAVAEGTLDYYHAMQHLGEAAGVLIADENERESWLAKMRAKVKKNGGADLHETLSGMLKREKLSNEAQKTAEREIKYFENHKEHMDYAKRNKEGRPIGSGAVESLCGQFQDRLKRRGQFWSRTGFAATLRAYVWFLNGELDYAIAPSAA